MNPLEKNNVRILKNDAALQTIVFVHGFGTDGDVWKQVQEPFQDKYRIILLDLVGANDTTSASYTPEEYPSLSAFATDIANVCRATNVHNAYIVGHSMGAIIGALATLQHPEYFSKIVMMTASPRYINDEDYIGGFEQRDLDELYLAMEQNYYSWVSGFAPFVMGNPDKPSLGQDFARSMGAVRPDIALSVLRTTFQSDHRKDVTRMNVPTLVLQSGRDAAVPPEVGAYLERSIPQCRAMMMNTVGHLPHVSAPDQVIQALNSFL